jgi:hypothetical protein
MIDHDIPDLPLLPFEPITTTSPFSSSGGGRRPRFYRAEVPGGWIVCQDTIPDRYHGKFGINPSIAFVPDPKHEWGKAEREARDNALAENRANEKRAKEAEDKIKAEHRARLRNKALHLFDAVADKLHTCADDEKTEATLVEIIDAATGLLEGAHKVSGKAHADR